MNTKQGKDIRPGDRLVRVDGQLMTVKRVTNGMCRDSRIAEFDRADEYGRLWATIFNRTQYEVENGGKK